MRRAAVAGASLAATLALAACGSGAGAQSGAATDTGASAHGNGAASTSASGGGAAEVSDSAGSSDVTPDVAKTRVERAAHVQLSPEPVPSDAREQGLRASYSNTASAAKDKQAVGLFVLKDADVADDVSDALRSSAPKSAQLIVNDKVIVVYAAAGSDRGTAVERAVKAL